MVFFAFLIGLFALITVFIPWVNLFRLNSVDSEIYNLRRKVKYLEDKLSGADLIEKPIDKEIKTSAPSVKAQAEKSKEKPEVKPTPKSRSSVPLVSSNDLIKTAQESFEKNVATKLPVWIGAISLICAAFFLVKYSIELGWMKPAVRLSLGGLFGLFLVVAGHWVLKRPHIANFMRISQGLVGAGLVALYVTIYASLNLYNLIPPLFGFMAMATVTGFAVILSLRHGQPIAVFGLLGGLLTPVLVGSDEPNAIAMFAYLFLLFTGMFSVLVRKGWWVLSVAAIVGVFVWSAFWFMLVFSPSDAIILVVFAIAVAAVVFAVTGRRVVENKITEDEKLPIHGLNFAAIVGGVITIAWLSFEVSLTLFDWSMLGLLSLALMVLAYFQPHVYQKPIWVKLGASILLYFIWAQDAPLADAITVLIGMSVVYVGAGYFLMRQVSDPRFWAALQAIAAISLYLIAYVTFDFSDEFIQSFGMFWGFVSLLLAGLAIYQVADIRQNYKADEIIEKHLLAIFTLVASAFISLGLAIELPWSYVPLAIAGQVAVTAMIYNRTKIYFLQQICIILTIVFGVLNYEQIAMFFQIFEVSVQEMGGSLSGIRRYVLDAPLIKLGIPAFLFVLSFLIFVKHKEQNKVLNHVLFGASLIVLGMAFYYLFRYVPHGDYVTALSTNAGFIERGILTLTIGVVGFGLLEGLKRFDLEYLKPWAIGLLIMAGSRYVGFDLLLHNPYWDDSQRVGDIALLNGITLTYGGAVLLSLWAIRIDDLKEQQGIFAVLGFVSLFSFSSLTVRQIFQGSDLTGGQMMSAELYGYSVVWLLTGIGLLAVGIMKQNKTVRMASLAFVLLAIVKAFLFDAAELDGLYRVFSFLGLGISLICLSYFYSKFVFKKDT